MRKRTASALLVASMAIAGHASAARIITSHPAAESKSMTVELGDLNPSERAGAATAYQRLRSAAKSVCGNPIGRVPISQRLQNNACADQSLDDAIQQVGTKLLQEIHSS